MFVVPNGSFIVPLRICQKFFRPDFERLLPFGIIWLAIPMAQEKQNKSAVGFVHDNGLPSGKVKRLVFYIHMGRTSSAKNIAQFPRGIWSF